MALFGLTVFSWICTYFSLDFPTFECSCSFLFGCILRSLVSLWCRFFLCYVLFFYAFWTLFFCNGLVLWSCCMAFSSLPSVIAQYSSIFSQLISISPVCVASLGCSLYSSLSYKEGAVVLSFPFHSHTSEVWMRFLSSHNLKKVKA